MSKDTYRFDPCYSQSISKNIFRYNWKFVLKYEIPQYAKTENPTKLIANKLWHTLFEERPSLLSKNNTFLEFREFFEYSKVYFIPSITRFINSQTLPANFFLYMDFVMGYYFLKLPYKITNYINDNNQTIIINNKKNQLFVSFLQNFNFFKSMSTGYTLHYLKIFKKTLRRKLSSFILQLKVILNIIEKNFNNNFFIFQIKGTKKNFFKWLNFLKIRVQNLKVLFYLYTPQLRYMNFGLKKIKSIKKRLKKKYIYNENLI